ncbi:Acetolactate synthase, mitochondrial [Podochytrium sp. JEL0797]|nr:Acetolactate synthase, mitochondrial [Podochytrium sp. JEL0797]
MPPKKQPLSLTTPDGATATMTTDASFVGMTGGQIFHEMMLRQGVKVVFGYPGGAILPVYDAIHNSEYFEFILPRHEQGAGHMAEGYARATGKVGVVLVTSGPGATNVITPMQDALSDGTPMVVFTGQVPTSALGTDAFQEADVLGISRSCTKWNVMVKDIAELPRRINEAFEIATSGRPGPVLVDLPKDVTAAILGKAIHGATKIPGKKPMVHVDDGPSPTTMKNIEKVANMLNRAEKPILYVGQGMVGNPEGHKILKHLVDTCNLPVTTTLMGLGAFDEEDPRSLHMLGMHGSAYANLAMQSADLIISLGARFDDRVTGNLKKFAPAAKKAALRGRGGIVQFEIMPKNINKVVQVDVSVDGDVAANVRHLIPLLQNKPRTEWFEQLDLWKQKYPFSYHPAVEGDKLKPQAVLEELSRQVHDIKDKVILTTGVGLHQMWTAQYYRWRHPRTMITSGGLGTMGFGLPAAIGAKVGRPDCMVIDIDGDASFSMTGMELMTARQFNIPVKVLILNNDFQGMVKQWQDLFYEKRYSGTVMQNPDFVKFAESMNCVGLRARTMEELPSVMAEFLACKEPVILDAVVTKDEHVYPMVPAGKALHEMELGSSVTFEENAKNFQNSKIIQDGDIVIAYVNPLDMLAITMKKDTFLNNKYGRFEHNTIIGKPFGARVGSLKGNGHMTFLHPTPELWTATLPHRTQILYMPDIALVSEMLDLKPGAVVVESGTGSGSFSHSIARTIAPTGKLHTFEYHEERVLKFTEELALHGIPTTLVQVSHRNVCKDGFDLEGVSDAVFLDLPSPWEAVEFAKKTFKKGKVGRICTFSPAIEQVQRTCEELEKHGFYDVRMFETLIRRQEVKTLTKRPVPTRDSVTGYIKGDPAIKKDHKRKRVEGDKAEGEVEKAADEGKGDADAMEDVEEKVATEPKEAVEVAEAVSSKADDQVIVSRTVAKVAGHTSFLVFASIYIE